MVGRRNGVDEALSHRNQTFLSSKFTYLNELNLRYDITALPLLCLDLPSRQSSWAPYSRLSHRGQAYHSHRLPRTTRCHHPLYTVSGHHRSRTPHPPLDTLPEPPLTWVEIDPEKKL